MELILRAFDRHLQDLVKTAVREVLAEQKPAAPEPVNRIEGLLSTAEAAKVAGVTPKTVRAWIASGALPAQHAGRHLRIARAALETFLQRGEDKPNVTAIADRVLRKTGTGT